MKYKLFSSDPPELSFSVETCNEEMILARKQDSILDRSTTKDGITVGNFGKKIKNKFSRIPTLN